MVSADPSVSERQAPVNGQGIASLVFGAIAVAVSFVPILGLPALILGPLAIVFALIGRSGKPRDTTCATAGLILGITATIVVLIVTLIFGSSLARLRDAIPANPFASGPVAEESLGVEFDESVAESLDETLKETEEEETDEIQPANPNRVATTGQVPGRDCVNDSFPGAEDGQWVTYEVESDGDALFNVDYGTAEEFACYEGVKGNWSDQRQMSDVNAVGITAWSDDASDQILRCIISIDGEVLADEKGIGAVVC